MKHLKIPNKLGISLLELVSVDKSGDKYNAALEISKSFCDKAAFNSAIVSLLKGNISNLRTVTDTMGLPYSGTSTIIAAATGNLDMLKNKLPSLSEKLKINNPEAMNALMNIAVGNLEFIRDLNNKNRLMTNDQFMLLEAVFTIMKESFKLRRMQHCISYKKVNKAIELIFNRMKDLLLAKAKTESSPKSNTNQNNAKNSEKEDEEDEEGKEGKEGEKDQEDKQDKQDQEVLKDEEDEEGEEGGTKIEKYLEDQNEDSGIYGLEGGNKHIINMTITAVLRSLIIYWFA